MSGFFTVRKSIKNTTRKSARKYPSMYVNNWDNRFFTFLGGFHAELFADYFLWNSPQKNPQVLGKLKASILSFTSLASETHLLRISLLCATTLKIFIKYLEFLNHQLLLQTKGMYYISSSISIAWNVCEYL